MLFPPTIAGGLPKPGWLAETQKLWPKWRLEGAELESAKRDAALLWIKEQEDAGIENVSDGEQFRTHVVHGFLETVEGIDWNRMTRMGIRNNRYEADVPTVTGRLARWPWESSRHWAPAPRLPVTVSAEADARPQSRPPAWRDASPGIG